MKYYSFDWIDETEAAEELKIIQAEEKEVKKEIKEEERETGLNYKKLLKS